MITVDTDRLSDFAISPDGAAAAALFIDGSVQIFESGDKGFEQVFKTEPLCIHTKAVCICFARFVFGTAFAFGDASGRIFLFQKTRPNEFTLLVTFNHHSAAINCIAFSPLNAEFAAVDADGVISVTKIVENQWKTEIFGISQNATWVCYGPPRFMSFVDRPNDAEKCQICVSSVSGEFTIFGENGGWKQENEPVLAHNGAVNCVAWRNLAGFSRYEIATCGDDGLVKLWSFNNGDWSSVDIVKMDERILSLKWSNCGFLLFVGFGEDKYKVYREMSGNKWGEIEEEE